MSRRGKPNTETGYIGVSVRKVGQKWCIGRFEAKIFIRGHRRRKMFHIAEEAAKWIDLQLIRNGEEPVNGFYKKVSNDNM